MIAPLAISDAARERLIRRAMTDLVDGPIHHRRAAWRRMRSLIRTRSPGQVRRMERAMRLHR